jgi:SAM-dependent methyltransferase
LDVDEQFWTRIGGELPYWGVLAHEKFATPELDPERKAEFFDSGRDHIAYVVDSIRRHVVPEFQPGRALDFGCGVGRLVAAMAARAGTVHGVDISPTMLARAEADLAALGVRNFALSTEIPEASFDWINSYIVFQHIMPAKGIALLEALLERLAPGGVVSLYFSIFRDREQLMRGIEESEFGRFDGERYVSYRRGALKQMPIYEYDLSEIIACLVHASVREFHMRHENHSGLHGVWIFGRKLG